MRFFPIQINVNRNLPEKKQWFVVEHKTRKVLAILPHDKEDGRLATHIAALLETNPPPFEI